MPGLLQSCYTAAAPAQNTIIPFMKKFNKNHQLYGNKMFNYN
nr:MAG TPA: hypothetical protein [Caudoviricetes sp.]